MDSRFSPLDVVHVSRQPGSGHAHEFVGIATQRGNQTHRQPTTAPEQVDHFPDRQEPELQPSPARSQNNVVEDEQVRVEDIEPAGQGRFQPVSPRLVQQGVKEMEFVTVRIAHVKHGLPGIVGETDVDSEGTHPTDVRHISGLVVSTRHDSGIFGHKSTRLPIRMEAATSPQDDIETGHPSPLPGRLPKCASHRTHPDT